LSLLAKINMSIGLIKMDMNQYEEALTDLKRALYILEKELSIRFNGLQVIKLKIYHGKEKYGIIKMLSMIVLVSFNIGYCENFLNQNINAINSYKLGKWFAEKLFPENDEFRSLVSFACDETLKQYGTELNEMIKQAKLSKQQQIEQIKSLKDLERNHNLFKDLIEKYGHIIDEDPDEKEKEGTVSIPDHVKPDKSVELLKYLSPKPEAGSKENAKGSLTPLSLSQDFKEIMKDIGETQKMHSIIQCQTFLHMETVIANLHLCIHFILVLTNLSQERALD